jgi:hypothetical protein
MEFKFKQKIERQKEIWIRESAVDDNKEFSDEKKKYFEEKFRPIGKHAEYEPEWMSKARANEPE